MKISNKLILIGTLITGVGAVVGLSSAAITTVVEDCSITSLLLKVIYTIGIIDIIYTVVRHIKHLYKVNDNI